MKGRLYRWADRWAVRIADRMGVTISRAKPLDLRGQDIHPLEAWYRAGRYQPVLMDVPLSKLRGLGSAAYPCTQDSGHPFIETLLEYESGSVRCYQGSVLENFYRKWQPQSAAEYLDVDDSQESASLQKIEATAAVFPWSRHDSSVQRGNVSQAIRLVSKKSSGRVPIDMATWHFFGPATKIAGEFEYQRIIDIYQSIKRQGFVRKDTFDGDVKGTLMVKDKEWRFLIGGGGQHRVSALSTMSFSVAPVRVFDHLPMIVRREDSSLWPLVAAGVFDEKTALSIFDRVFEGRQPRAISWLDGNEVQF